MKRVKVALVRCNSYESDEVYKAVKTSISLIGGVKQFKKYGERVLLKPNILRGANPSQAITTHPSVFEAAISVFKEAGFEVMAGESPGFEGTISAAKKSGLLDIAKRHGIIFDDFKEVMEVSNPYGEIVKRFTVAKAAVEADFIVSIPKFKTHSLMYYTGAVKNLFGCLPGIRKAKFHFKFPERFNFASMLVDLCVLLNPRLSIMDAIIAMEGKGPSSGNPRKVGLIIASTDPVALDYVGVSLMGYDYRKIPFIMEAFGRKDFVNGPDEIEIVGEKLETVKPKDFKKIKIISNDRISNGKFPLWLKDFVQNIFFPKPFFMKNLCTGCGKCIEICPASALDFSRDKHHHYIEADYKKCIRCYCCDEICPSKAIKIKRFLFL